MEETEDKSHPNDGERKEIEIHYDRTPRYRTYHVDGMRGNWSPGGKLTVDFYVERYASPQIVRHAIDDSGQLGKVTQAGGDRSGVIRDAEGGLVMDPQTALRVYAWLGDKLKEGIEWGFLDRETAIDAGIIDEDTDDVQEDE